MKDYSNFSLKKNKLENVNHINNGLKFSNLAAINKNYESNQDSALQIEDLKIKVEELKKIKSHNPNHISPNKSKILDEKYAVDFVFDNETDKSTLYFYNFKIFISFYKNI